MTQQPCLHFLLNDKKELMESFKHFHDEGYNSDFITCNQLAHEYSEGINIIVDENDVKKTTNLTYKDEQFKMTEISFNNSDYEQVAVSKISRPITLRDGSVTEIEINFDF
jgi:hypothetical protein